MLDDTNAWGYVALLILLYCPNIWSGWFGDLSGFMWTCLILLMEEARVGYGGTFHDTMDAVMTDRVLIVIIHPYLCHL